MVELNLKNIYKKYPNSDHYSVEDFNLDIKDKEFIVFVGPSGCGKSTRLPHRLAQNDPVQALERRRPLLISQPCLQLSAQLIT